MDAARAGIQAEICTIENASAIRQPKNIFSIISSNGINVRARKRAFVLAFLLSQLSLASCVPLMRNCTRLHLACETFSERCRTSILIRMESRAEAAARILTRTRGSEIHLTFQSNRRRRRYIHDIALP